MAAMAPGAADLERWFDEQKNAILALIARCTGQQFSTVLVEGEVEGDDDESDAFELSDRDMHALKQLKELRDCGVLTQEEFELKKAKILGTSVPHRPSPPSPQPSPPSKPSAARLAPASVGGDSIRPSASKLDVPKPSFQSLGASPGREHAGALQGSPNPFSGGEKDKGTRQMFDKRQLRRDKARSYVPAVAEWRAANESAGRFSLDGRAEGSRQWLRVYIRKRPLFEREEAAGEFEVVSVPPVRAGVAQTLTVHACLTEADLKRMFLRNVSLAGHGVFGDESTSEDVYESMARPLVSHAVEGGLSTIFSFGQTGSGKTFTCAAVEAMAAAQVFQEVQALAERGVELWVALTFVELQGNSVLDLLAPTPCALSLRDDASGVAQLEGARKLRVHSAAALIEQIELCKARRKTERTLQNATSSRSHALLRLALEEPWPEPQPEPPSDSAAERRLQRPDTASRPWQQRRAQPEAPAARRAGLLVLVDLAGSERKEDSMWHTAERRREGALINASLYALKECMRAMASADDSSAHTRGARAAKGRGMGGSVPYKQCALTRVLAQSFVHDSAMTAVLATVSPGSADTEHTLHTLHSVCAMGHLDALTRESRSEVREVVGDDEHALSAGAPSANLPSRWTHARVKEWLAAVNEGAFSAQAAALPAAVDGSALVKQPVTWFKQVLCNGDEKRANLVYAALRAEVYKANKERHEHVLKVGRARESNKYTS